MHLNTVFLVIENVFFDRSKGFFVWAILCVGHLCLYNSIKKEVASNKKKKTFSIKKNHINQKKKKI